MLIEPFFFAVHVFGNLKHQKGVPQILSMVTGGDLLKTHHQNFLIPAG